MPIPATYVHTNLTGRDWRALARFYCDVFGCPPKPPERDLSGTWLDNLTAHLTGVHLLLPGRSPTRHWLCAHPSYHKPAKGQGTRPNI